MEVIADGWSLQHVPLDTYGYDKWGWHWGNNPLPLWHLSDGFDSVTTRAPTAEEALAVITAVAGMPPHRRLTVHDEAISEVDIDRVDVPEFSRIMATPTKWSEQIQVPIDVEAWAGSRYKK